jgi:hypothetical protein
MKTFIVFLTFIFFGISTPLIKNTHKKEPQYHILLPEIVITPDKSDLYREGSVYNPIELDEVVITAENV